MSPRLARMFLTLSLLLVQGPVWADLPPLKLGIVPTLSARNLLTLYEPLRSHLESELKRPVEVYTATDFKTFHQRTVAGEYPLVITVAHMARLAQREAGIRPIATYRLTLKGYMAAPKDKQVASVDALRGGALALPDRLGLVVIRGIRWLQEQGLEAGRDYRILQTPSHSSAAHSLTSGEATMAIIGGIALKQMPEEIRSKIHILNNYTEVPSLTWMVASDMPDGEARRIKQALLAFESTPEGKRFIEAAGIIGIRDMNPDELKQLDRDADELKRLLSQES